MVKQNKINIKLRINLHTKACTAITIYNIRKYDPLDEGLQKILKLFTIRLGIIQDGIKPVRNILMPHEKEISLSIIIALFGDYSVVLEETHQLLNEIAQTNLKENIELIFIISSRVWEPPLLNYLTFNSNIKYYYQEQASITPATLFNQGALLAKHKYLTFFMPGFSFRYLHNIWPEIQNKIKHNSKHLFFTGHPTQDSFKKHVLESWHQPQELVNLTLGYPSGFLELFDYLPMAYSILKRESFLKHKGFSTSVLLQRGFWWEYSLRFARREPVFYTNIATPNPTWSWDNYPLNNDLALSGDLVARRILRYHLPQAIETQDNWSDTAFLRDLDATTLRVLARKFKNTPMHAFLEANINNTAKKIVVLGGINEPAHNQLCFYNYFSLIEGKGILNWRTIFDENATHPDLINADLVIFSRCKSKESVYLAEFCNKQKIPILYMLDDNWFSIGQEWPLYKDIFAPGRPFYDNALACIQKANCVLTYNTILAEDLSIHSNHVRVIPPNINLTLFQNKLQSNRNRRTIVGYVGTNRIESRAAYKALAKLAKIRDDFDIFIMSNQLPDAFKALPKERIIFNPYVFSYNQYVYLVNQVAPDILLAPLGNTRTEASKCPNKYFEISALGAAGIYSRVAPYTNYVEAGKTGLLVDNHINDWITAIEQLLNNKALCTQIKNASIQNIKEQFQSEQVFPVFLDLLQQHWNKKEKPAEKIKVAFVSHSAGLAGAEIALKNLLEYLPKEQIDPWLIFPDTTDAPIQEYCSQQLQMKCQNLTYSCTLQEPLFQNLQENIRLFSDFIKESQIDCIVINTTALAPAFFAAIQNKIPVLLHCHGTIDFNEPRQQKQFTKLEYLQLQLATHCFVPSNYTKNQIISRHGIAFNNIDILPNGTKIMPVLETINLEKPALFTMLCTLEPQKGILDFLTAAKNVLIQRPELARFELYGNPIPGYAEKIEQFIIENNIAHAVTIYPKQPDPGVIYQRSSAVIIASAYESFSLVTIEAMAHGRPVIASRCGGPEELIDHDINGYLFNTHDINSLTRAMIDLIDNPEKIQQFGKHGQEKVRDYFSAEKIAKSYYEQILALSKTESLNNNHYLLHNYLFSLQEKEYEIQNIHQTSSCQPPVESTLNPTQQENPTVSNNLSQKIIKFFQKNPYEQITINNEMLLEMSQFSYQYFQLNRKYQPNLSNNLNTLIYQEYLMPKTEYKIRELFLAFFAKNKPSQGVFGIEIVSSNQILRHFTYDASTLEINKHNPTRFLFSHPLPLHQENWILRAFTRNIDVPVSIIQLGKNKSQNMPLFLYK